eukprot:1240889-Prymnesium_polylepis.1
MTTARTRTGLPTGHGCETVAISAALRVASNRATAPGNASGPPSEALAPIGRVLRMVNKTDASAAHALVLGRSRSPLLQRAYAILRAQPAFQAAQPRASCQL